MNSPKSRNFRRIEDKAFVWLVIGISLLFIWTIVPFYGSVLWAVVVAILFSGIYQRILAATRNRQNIAALATLLLVVVIIILPLTVLIVSVVAEASALYDRLQSGDLNFAQYLQRILDSLPSWATDGLNRLGLTNLGAFKEKLSATLSHASKLVAVQALHIGQNAFRFLLNLFVMLYILFFLLRDGAKLSSRVRDCIPLRPEYRTELWERFAIVIRATVKGNLLVALLQGGLGGLIFWILKIQAPLLWAAVMAILSLLPAVGPAMVWLPVSVYLFSAGEISHAVILILYGTFVIGLADNFVRPMLVGKDTQMPDYLVLVSTLGGVAAFGVNGFVLGPLVAAMFISIWDLFTQARKGGDQPTLVHGDPT